MKCKNCPYIKDEYDIKASYEEANGLIADEYDDYLYRECYCDKIGGKIGYFGFCGDTNKTDAGNYSIILSLQDKHGYIWSDGTQNDKVINYRINKVHNNMKVSVNKHIIKMYPNCQRVVPITIKNSTKNISIKTSNKKIKVGSNKDCIIIPRNFYSNIKIVVIDKGDKDHYSKKVVLKLKIKKIK